MIMKKNKIHLEFLLNETAKHVLWMAISSGSGLENWFAEKVQVNGKMFTFKWDGNEERSAEMVASRVYSFIRFHWIDDEDSHYYFEIRMSQNDMTNSYVLEINDFASEDEAEDLKELWTSQVIKMRRVWGF